MDEIIIKKKKKKMKKHKQKKEQKKKDKKKDKARWEPVFHKNPEGETVVKYDIKINGKIVARQG